MNPLAQKIYNYYNSDSGAFDDEIKKWGIGSARAVGERFGYLIGDAYTALRDDYSSADTWGVLEFGTETFTNLDTTTQTEVGEAIIADYKKRNSIA